MTLPPTITLIYGISFICSCDLLHVPQTVRFHWFHYTQHSAFPLVQQVAHSLEFAPLITALARRVIDGVSNSGEVPYNSVHLRVERDAEAWATIMGGQDVVWQGYQQAMGTAGFNGTTRLYVASALLTYGASNGKWGG